MRFLLWAMLSGLIGLIAVSFLGAWHPVGDSLAVFRVLLATMALLVAIFLVRGAARFVGVLALVGLGVASPVAGYVYHALNDTPGPYTLYQKNLLYSNDDHEGLVNELRDIRPDFITMQELWPDTIPIWDSVLDLYPHRVKCFGWGGNSASILSRWPIVAGSQVCHDNLGYSSARVELPEGQVTLVSLHLPWPFPYRQADRLESLIPMLQDLPGPVLLGGDFNMVPWSNTVAQIEAATGTKRAGVIQSTFVGAGGILRLPIDHILTPQGQGQVELRPLLGSDHKGLLLRFAL